MILKLTKITTDYGNDYNMLRMTIESLYNADKLFVRKVVNCEIKTNACTINNTHETRGCEYFNFIICEKNIVYYPDQDCLYN